MPSTIKKTKQPRLLEKQIKAMILQWLSLQSHCLAFNHDSVGIFDQRRGVFRKRTGPHHRNGVSDIVGIWKSRPLAIEVKTHRGIVSDDQQEFLDEWRLKGGIAILARSIDDVIFQLGEYDLIHAKV